MPDLFKIELEEAIAEIDRELAQRARVYPGQIQMARLSARIAERRIERLEAARQFLVEYRKLTTSGGQRDERRDARAMG